jgi:hypothetical protein
MTRNEAVCKAQEFVAENSVEVGSVADVRYIDVNVLNDLARECPPDVLETYRSVKTNLRNHWVVTFKLDEPPGRVSCPSSRLVCVYDSGEVSLCG